MLSSEETMKQDSYILVVDDDIAILETIQDVLEFEGYRVKTLHDGTQILQQVHAETPGMILLDLRMPMIDGRALYHKPQEDAVAARIPVVLVTADGSGSAYASELGAASYLAKPFDIDTLFACVERFMGSPKEIAP
jgi:DNA-binding response OmpR family regulator